MQIYITFYIDYTELQKNKLFQVQYSSHKWFSDFFGFLFKNV